jgi:hypothetical protein
MSCSLVRTIIQFFFRSFDPPISLVLEIVLKLNTYSTIKIVIFNPLFLFTRSLIFLLLGEVVYLGLESKGNTWTPC